MIPKCIKWKVACEPPDDLPEAACAHPEHFRSRASWRREGLGSARPPGEWAEGGGKRCADCPAGFPSS